MKLFKLSQERSFLIFLVISLFYEQGQLRWAATRGDGDVGEDVTENVLCLAGIPRKLEDVPDILEVRGEIFLSREEFRRLNMEAEEFMPVMVKINEILSR